MDDAQSIAEVHFAAAHEIYEVVLPRALLSCLSVDVRAKQWRDLIAKSADVEDDAVFVAEVSNGNPIGFGYCSPQGSLNLAAKGFNGEIQSLFLTKSTRGNGAGKALMAAMAAIFCTKTFMARPAGSCARTSPLADSMKIPTRN